MEEQIQFLAFELFHFYILTWLNRAGKLQKNAASISGA